MTYQEMEDEDIRLKRDPNDERTRHGIRYVREPIGRLQGLRIWARPIRKVIAEELHEEMLKLLGQNYYELSEPRLLRLTKWIDDTERVFNEAEALLLEGQAFFKKDNLEYLKYFEIRNDVRATLTRNLRSFCAKQNLT